MIYIHIFVYIYIYMYDIHIFIYIYIYIYIWYIYVTNLFFAHHIAIFHIAQWQVADLFCNCPRNKETKFHLYVFTNFLIFGSSHWELLWKKVCQILVVQRSTTWISEYILISLSFLFSAKLIIIKEG